MQGRGAAPAGPAPAGSCWCQFSLQEALPLSLADALLREGFLLQLHGGSILPGKGGLGWFAGQDWLLREDVLGVHMHVRVRRKRDTNVFQQAHYSALAGTM